MATASADITGIWECTNREYDEDRTCVRSSALKVFAQSRPLYHGLYVSGAIKHSEPTPSMVIGTLLHAMILEPQDVEFLFVDKPDRAKRSKEDKDFWKEWDAAHANKIAVTAEQRATATAMATAISNHEGASAILGMDECEAECPVRWIEETKFGPVACKARIDWWWKPHRFINDIKTSSCPVPQSDWAMQAANLGYHLQAAFYLRFLKAIGESGNHCSIVVGNEPPYEVALYQWDKDSLAFADQQITELLTDLAECRAKNRWPSRARESHIETVSLPRWILKGDG